MAMNDPHVVALHYRTEHVPDVVDWSRAAPMDKEEHRFRMRAANGRVRFELKEHCASEEAARFAVETDHIRNWEFVVGLERGPNAFTLRFDHSEIVDRKPPPGPPRLIAHARLGGLTARTNLAPPTPPAFPEPPPASIRRSPDVDSMYRRYLGHLDGKEPLSRMAYLPRRSRAHVKFVSTELPQFAESGSSGRSPARPARPLNPAWRAHRHVVPVPAARKHDVLPNKICPVVQRIFASHPQYFVFRPNVGWRASAQSTKGDAEAMLAATGERRHGGAGRPPALRRRP